MRRTLGLHGASTGQGAALWRAATSPKGGYNLMRYGFYANSVERFLSHSENTCIVWVYAR